MDHLKSLLRKGGLKATKKRLEVLKLLKVNNRSYSALEINSHFNFRRNRVTIYRILADFHRVGIVGRFTDNTGVTHYYYGTNYDPLAPCFRCLDCGVMVELPALPDFYLKYIEKFTITESSLLFFGTCGSCLKGKKK